MKFSKYIEAPEVDLYAPRPWLFLAGGISGVEDWQTEAKNRLLMSNDFIPPFQESVVHGLTFDFGGTIFNPRRSTFDMSDTSIAEKQITWEFNHLKEADAILFWFQYETLQPIVLFELGRWSYTDKPLFIGVHPDYPRKYDVEVQMKLARPLTPIYDSLTQLCYAVNRSP
jgi:hypothetical protein